MLGWIYKTMVNCSEFARVRVRECMRGGATDRKTADLWLSGTWAWMQFAFFLHSFLSSVSGGIPRAVKRARAVGAPSTPGRLGYITSEQFMDCAIALDAASTPGITYFNTHNKGMRDI
jgi:hypothetical protein